MNVKKYLPKKVLVLKQNVTNYFYLLDELVFFYKFNFKKMRQDNNRYLTQLTKTKFITSRSFLNIATIKNRYQEANNIAFSDEIQTNERIIESRFTKILREKRSSKKGLLLIYPILPIDFKSVPRLNEDKDPLKDFNNSWKKFKIDFKENKNAELLKDIESRKALISLAVSFPKTSDNLSVNAIVNNVFKRIRNQEDGAEE